MKEKPQGKNEQTSQDRDSQNQRFIQGVSYLSEWAKHIITLASGILVLGVTLLKDIVRPTGVALTIGILSSLGISFTLLLISVWNALGFVRLAASSILSKAPVMGSGDELQRLQKRLNATRQFFLLGLLSFAVMALLSIVSWSFAGSPAQHPPAGAAARAAGSGQFG
jgi:hypothetical protein